jgi:hypothetical protein
MEDTTTTKTKKSTPTGNRKLCFRSPYTGCAIYNATKLQQYIVACRTVTMRRPRDRQIPDSFLGNCSVNTFPLLGSRLLIIRKLYYKNGKAVFSTSSVLKGYKQNEGFRLVKCQLEGSRRSHRT